MNCFVSSKFLRSSSDLYSGTRKAAEPYKVGKKTTDLVIEILNLNKMEVVPIDTISNQEFTEVRKL